MNNELQALQDADFGWVRPLESVWNGDDKSDAGPNQNFADAIIAELATLQHAPNPPGRIFVGQAGIGKTHFVGTLCRGAWSKNCWFVMLDVVGITDFWKSAALSFVTSLLQVMPDGRKQYEAIISGIARRFNIEEQVNLVFDSQTVEPKRVVDLLVRGLLQSDMDNALKYRDVFRALALLRSHDVAAIGIAHAWLQGFDSDELARQSFGFLSGPPDPVEIVSGLLWVMSLAGPTLIAVDQIDGVLSSGNVSDVREAPDYIKLLTGGLLDLTRKVKRSTIVVTCLLSSWESVKSYAVESLPQSFTSPLPLRLPQTESFVRKLVSDRLAPAYAKAAIVPKSSTWPFSESAIKSAADGMTPRKILMRCDEHRRICLAEDRVIECETLLGPSEPPPPLAPPAGNEFDAVYVAAAEAANLDGLFDDKDDGMLGMLLRDAFDLYAKQIPPRDEYDVESRSDPVQKTPPLHGRLAFTDHRARDRERHFCFRALQHGNAVALCARLRAALTASGVSARIPDRKLIIVRRGPQPRGPKTAELFEAFRNANGIEIDPTDADLRKFLALRQMRDEALADSKFDAFERWLVARQPLCQTEFFHQAGLVPPPLPPWDNVTADTSRSNDAKNGPLPPPGRPKDSPAATHPANGGAKQDSGAVRLSANDTQNRDEALERSPVPPVQPNPSPITASLTNAIPVGYRLADGRTVDLSTSLLPRHTAIIAGAGSGKTVLLRRIVEEAALAGIPAIVIDPNNDLSRLGEAWPSRPAGFSDEDEAKAKRYAATVEVVVWTPGVHAGNPLFLSVLPDFSAIGDDRDERDQGVAMAADTLGPLAGAKSNLQKGVLADALRAFAKQGGGDLKAITALLADLPDGVSEIGNAGKLADKMADELKAAVATNPLLKATGPVLDPQLLFYGSDSSKTRVSVINLSGLASDEAKEDFVNRLHMTLFGWVKKHPSPRGLLYVIDEAQVFIPSGSGALSKTSGVQLVAQARKYGLGMIVVTQAPKGIDNKVVSNCTTQFLGKQNSPTDQQSVKNMIAATGGTADDIGKLAAGEFYFKTENSGKPFKLRTPICLSYHPQNPPTPEEVVARAKRSLLAG